MDYSYYAQVEDLEVSANEVIEELINHGQNPAEFFADVKPMANGLWDAQTVLAWLGY